MPKPRTINKTQLIEEVHELAGINKKDAKTAVNAALQIIGETLSKGGSVKLASFGSFNVVKRKKRVGVNPRDPVQKIKIPARKVPVFKPSKVLKENVR